MPDLAEVTTTDPVNAGQLSSELDGAALKVIGPDADGVTTVRALEPDDGVPVDPADLDAAVTAHVADPEWTDPTPPPPEKQARLDAADRIEQLRQRVLDGGSLSQADGLEVLEHALRLGRL